jgi:hypothetical protein
MKFASFENDGGEGVVGFEPCRTSGPEYLANHSLWYHGLTVDGVRIFQYGCPCGTCGTIFKKIASPEQHVSDGEAVRLLGRLDEVPSNLTLTRLARVLPRGRYQSAIVEGFVRIALPGADNDYFAGDVVALFGLAPPEYKRPEDPGTPYYRFADDRVLREPGATTSSLLTQIIMPLHDPRSLDRQRVEYWKERARCGEPLTAFGVSLFDVQSPAVLKSESARDDDYPHGALMLLTHCLLDGHHRTAAASELGAPIRLLTLLNVQASCVADGRDVLKLLEHV